jgi:alkaline phosphatase
MSRLAFFAAALLLTGPSVAFSGEPNPTADYRASGEAELARLKATPPVRTKARNLIIFIGDGMGISTLTAGRIYIGQSLGKDGESYVTTMDGMDYAAMVKTYSHDKQVADSAPTATAIMTGVKTLNGVIGVGPETKTGDCKSGLANVLPTIFGIAAQADHAIGVVTTTRITHATPASTYAAVAFRDWESDDKMSDAAKADGCLDIARQLVEGPIGRNFDVILGGGRANLLPKTSADPEYPNVVGLRLDGRDLIAAWKKANPQGLFAWNEEQFRSFDPARQKRILGLFEPDHMKYEADRANDPAGEPSLSEMVETAIKTLSLDRDGYVLLVEGGRIDHAHHAGNARRALEDTKALDNAVATALRLVDLNDTLVIATADHSHTLTITGYPARGNPILGTVGPQLGEAAHAKDGKAYTTLSYANGPGAVSTVERPDPETEDTGALDYKQQALVPLQAETHGGEDVAAHASGPGAHLFRGTIEQNTIFYIMREALFGGRTDETTTDATAASGVRDR